MSKLAAAALAVALVACGSPAGTPAPPLAPTPGPALAPPPPAPLAAPPTFRLPGDVVPTAARLDLTIVPAQPDAPGHIGFDADIRRATRVVWLNATDIAVTAATLNGEAAHVIPGGDDIVGLTLERELAPGPLVIAVDFTAHIDHAKSRGLYAEAEGAETYAYTFFEATDARRAFPCFDEPAYKIPWQLTLHVLHDHVALGNAPVEGETEEPGGMKRVRLATSRPLPSYLVAIVVGPFEVVDGGVAGRAKTPIRFVIPKGRAAELAFAKATTPRIVTALEDYFDMPYPYGKLDVAVVPRFWGTMEHPGLLAMGQPLALIRADESTRERKQGYVNIGAHELAHYWFGDYVTMAWWDDTWLNEALGEWLDAIITTSVEPTWRFELDRVDRARAAMAADETLATPKIRQPVTKAEDIEAAFDGEITYLKGSSVLRMFEASVGPDAWRAFMRTWVRDHAWGTASADDLFAALRTQLGPTIEAGVRSFVEQPGVPRIAATLRCAGTPALALHQSRALPAGATDPAPHTWTVPVCVRWGSAQNPGRRTCTTLGTTDGELVLDGPCPTWLVMNAEGAGYYRTAIAAADADATLQLLTPGSPAARAAKPTPAEKLMLIADVRAAVDRDELTIAQALALAPRVALDPDPRIARTALELGHIRVDVLEGDLHARARSYLLHTYRPIATRLGWTRRRDDSDDTQKLRRGALAVARYDAGLTKDATKLARRWFDDRTVFDDDLFEVVFDAAAVHGDQALFDRIRARAKAPRDRGEQARLVAVLGGFTDPKLLAQALALTLGGDFDLRDSIGILYSALGAEETRAQALGFIEAHLDELLARMRDDEIGWLLGALAGISCDAPTRERIAALVMPRAPKHSGAQAAVDKGLAESATCIATFAHQLPSLRTFLQAQPRP